MNITYSLAKHGDVKLSENFRVREFRCKDGANEVIVCDKTVEVLQAVRDYFGKPVTINSAYRTPSHNKAVGGATNSQHVKGTACDIKINGIPPKAIASFIEAKYPAHGIGLYSTFVHVDSRGKATYWDQRSGTQKVVNTFGLGNMYEQYKAEGEDMLSYEDFKQYMNRYIAELNLKPASNWASAEVQKAVDSGITDGKNPQGICTREQAVAMIVRALNK